VAANHPIHVMATFCQYQQIHDHVLKLYLLNKMIINVPSDISIRHVLIWEPHNLCPSACSMFMVLTCSGSPLPEV